jgi:hypothetical protein
LSQRWFATVGVVDPNSGKKNLLGIFDRVHAINFPTAREMSLYFKISDAEGQYQFQIRLVNIEGERSTEVAEGQGTIPDRTQSADYLVPLGQVVIPEEGRYELQIRCNGSYLGGITLDAMRR